MMIDDNIDFLNEAKKFFEDIANNPSIDETVKTYFIIESLESAMDIMRKYQKIQEIVDDWQNQNDPRIKFAMCCDNMKKITKVVKDENVD